jgi:hypothetical protein
VSKDVTAPTGPRTSAAGLKRRSSAVMAVWRVPRHHRAGVFERLADSTVDMHCSHVIRSPFSMSPSASALASHR